MCVTSFWFNICSLKCSQLLNPPAPFGNQSSFHCPFTRNFWPLSPATHTHLQSQLQPKNRTAFFNCELQGQHLVPVKTLTRYWKKWLFVSRTKTGFFLHHLNVVSDWYGFKCFFSRSDSLIQVMQLEVEIFLCIYNSVRPKLTKGLCTCYRFDQEIKQDKCVTEEEYSKWRELNGECWNDIQPFLDEQGHAINEVLCFADVFTIWHAINDDEIGQPQKGQILKRWEGTYCHLSYQCQTYFGQKNKNLMCLYSGTSIVFQWNGLLKLYNVTSQWI